MVFSNIKKTWIYIAQVLLLATCYFISGEASFSVVVSHNIVTLVVFAAEGFALAAVILLGIRVVPGIFLGQLLLALNNGLVLELALEISVINSLEAVLGYMLFKRLHLKTGLDRMIDVSSLLMLIFLVLQPFSASFGTLLLWNSGIIETSSLKITWFSWWFGNSLGQVLITPMLLAFFNQTIPLNQRFYRTLLIVFLITPISLLILSQTQSSMMLAFAITTPLLILIAVHLGMSAATLATVIFAAVALFYTHNGQGVFVSDNAILIQDLNIFLLGIALCSQFIATLLNQQKKMQQALSESEAKFRAIINSSPVPLALNDEQQKITLLNPAFIKIFGYTLKDIPKVSDWWSKAYPDVNYRQWVISTWRQHFEKAKQKQCDFEAMELNICCKNGDYKTVLVSATAIETSFENESLIVLYDITERKHNEERVKLCQTYGGIVTWEVDLRTHRQIWSDEAFTLFNFPKLNSPIWEDFLTVIYPEDRQKVIDKIQTHIINNEPYEVEYRIIDRDKKTRWIRSSGRAERDIKGEAIYLRGIGQDITQRKLIEQSLCDSQQLLQSVMDILPVGLWILDGEGQVLQGNPAAKKIWAGIRYVGREQYGEYKAWWLETKEPVKADEWGAARAITKGETSLDEELEIECFDGRHKIISNSVLPLFDDNQNVKGAIVVNRDITKHKQAEEELHRSNVDLEQFAYAISHDMRQPLRMVASYLELLEDSLEGQLNPETQKLFDFAVEGAKRMDEMILALLDFSKVGRNSQTIKLMDMRTALDEALIFLTPEIKSNKGIIEVSGEWIKLFANHDEMTRLLQNLIGNALKYHPADKIPKVAINAEIKSDNFQVTISDNGIGINPTQIKRLFKVFSRLQARSRFEGTGIGLALCRKIVEHHGGKIWVESKGDRQGAVFKFNIPIKTA